MVWQPSHSNINLVPCAHRTTVVDNCGQTSGPSEGNLVSPGAHQAAPPAPGATEQRCPAGAGNLSSAHMERDERIRGYFADPELFRQAAACERTQANPQNQIRRQAVQS